MARSGGDARATGPWREPRSRGRSCEMASEPARDGQPLTPVVRVRVDRQPCPRERQLGSDPLSARPLEELDEPLQQPAVLGHLKPEPATDAKIVGERVA